LEEEMAGSGAFRFELIASLRENRSHRSTENDQREILARMRI